MLTQKDNSKGDPLPVFEEEAKSRVTQGNLQGYGLGLWLGLGIWRNGMLWYMLRPLRYTLLPFVDVTDEN